MIKQLVEKLKAPIPYSWRVQSRTKDRSKAMCTAYIDARDVMNVLDQHCEYGWESQFREVAGFIFAGIGIRDDKGNTYWRWDAGQRVEDNAQDQMYDQAAKSAASDAFKRAAVQWGVGRFLYDLDIVSLPCDQFGNVVDEKGQRVWDLTKHINGRKSKAPELTSTVAASPAITTSNTEAPAELPALQPRQFDAMVKAITEGKAKEVEAALPKYKLNLAQKTTLNKLLKDAKP
jgi:hypothetical protein